jgi:hypothetical protein
MTSILNIFFPDFTPAATIENQLVAPPDDAPTIEDPEAYDREIRATLARGLAARAAESAAESV